MENWLTRIVALFCALGSAGLFWTFGVFVVVPWHNGRMLSMSAAELQVTGIPLLLGLATAWGALHIFALADRSVQPKKYAMTRIVLIIAWLAATAGGVLWTLGRIS